MLCPGEGETLDKEFARCVQGCGVQGMGLESVRSGGNGTC